MKMTFARSVVMHSHLEEQMAAKPLVKHILWHASRLVIPRRQARLEVGKAIQNGNHVHQCICYHLLHRRRTVSGKMEIYRNAPFAWWSTKSGSSWHVWSACASFIKRA